MMRWLLISDHLDIDNAIQWLIRQNIFSMNSYIYIVVLGILQILVHKPYLLMY